MIRYLPIVIEIGLLIYAMVDCLMADERRVRNLPKLAWALIILLPFAGPIAWFLAGRPQRELDAGPAGKAQFQVYEPPRPVAPDDDPAFLDSLKQRQADQDLFKKWEDDLRRREEEFKNRDGDGPEGPADPTSRPDEPERPAS